MTHNPRTLVWLASGPAPGDWPRAFPGDIVERITAEHGAVMQRYGYLA